MRTLPLLCLLLLPVGACAGDFKDGQQARPRVKAAYQRHGAEVEAAFRTAGAAWPPKGIFLRAFKADDVVELWAAPPKAGGRYVKVRDFAVCARSGVLGPKRRVGDFQVPEGFFTIDRFNPQSSYHLSLGLDYPTVADRARTPRGVSPGGDIFVHGQCVTIGCLPLQDDPMEALYVAAVEARSQGQSRIPVHVFPCRLDQPDCQVKLGALSAQDPELAGFWGLLRPGYLAFEATGRPPRVTPLKDGSWQVDPR
ncbi:MAG: hypothetical protein KC549_18425 [Myxococcales bacterium]|nr:hypothetical protein [Myxococcales bacterium]MCB9548754.1 hypothetical protein [Myxococcales bacterium]